MLKNFKRCLFLLLTFLFYTGCSSTTPQEAVNPCKNLEEPTWIYENYVGSARITASGNKTQQKNLALQRALSTLLMVKGSAKGSSEINVKKQLSKIDENETLFKRFKQNSSFNVTFEEIKYHIKIINIWENPCTKEIFVQIKEK